MEYTFEISFTPARKTNGGHSLLLSMLVSDPLRARIRVNARNLAECEAAFANALEAAGHISAQAVDAASPSHTHNDGPPRVCVMASWKSMKRKPNGFNAKRWQAYVAPAGSEVAV